MVDWENIRHFLAVARYGTLSGAARRLKVDHATVSRRLSALEAALDVRLVERLPRSCQLTAVGRKVLERAKEMEAGAEGISRLAQAAHAPLSGRVTLSAPPVLVTYLFLGQIARFRAEFPEIRLSLVAEGQQISLSHREADVAVRLVQSREAGNVGRKIGTMPFSLYAHRNYVHLGAPERWQFIAFNPHYSEMPQQQWLLQIAGDRQVACELNYISEHLIAARAGVGVAGLPRFIGDRDPDLILVDENLPTFSRDIWLLVHRDLRKTPAVRAVMDFAAILVAECKDISDRPQKGRRII